MALSFEVKQLTYLAILALIAVLVTYAGALYALVTNMITFPEFLAAVGTLTGLIVGYLARVMQTTTTPTL